MLSFFSIFSAHAASPRRGPGKPSGPRYFRPSLEGFEDRVVPAALAHEVAQVAQVVQPAAITDNIVINSVQLSNFQIVDNVLKASGTVSGTLAGLPFTTNITNFALQLVPDDPTTGTPENPVTECSVLHLELAPIHLQLLGLHVDTSAICLNITATEEGGVLGDLLCSLAGGGPLGTGTPLIPTGGLGGQQSTLQGVLTDLLKGALNNNPAGPGQGDDSVCTGQCHVLELSIGPLDLSLLGLNVHLDDCAKGPVQVCVSATRREGLLGSLLCSLSDNRLLNLSLADITQLVDRATSLLSDGTLSGLDRAVLRNLLNQLVR